MAHCINTPAVWLCLLVGGEEEGALNRSRLAKVLDEMLYYL
jgi:hypothetical protein